MELDGASGGKGKVVMMVTDLGWMATMKVARWLGQGGYKGEEFGIYGDDGGGRIPKKSWNG